MFQEDWSVCTVCLCLHHTSRAQLCVVCLQGDVMLKKLLNLLASYSKLQFVDPSQPRLLPRCMFVSRIVRGDHTLTVCFCPCVCLLAAGAILMISMIWLKGSKG